MKYKVAEIDMNGWDWSVRCYYGCRSKRGTPGTLAIETVHRGNTSKDAEVAAGSRRRDIGRVDVLSLTDRRHGWVTVYQEKLCHSST